MGEWRGGSGVLLGRAMVAPDSSCWNCDLRGMEAPGLSFFLALFLVGGTRQSDKCLNVTTTETESSNVNHDLQTSGPFKAPYHFSQMLCGGNLVAVYDLCSNGGGL